jgi:phosphoglycerate dehydrogenase-like enzyme
MGIKVLFTYNYGTDKMDKIEKLGYDVKVVNEKEVKYNSLLEDVEILVCYDPFKTLDICKMKNLKWIQLSSAGIDQLPIDYVKNNSISITNNNGGYSVPMGEWIVLKSLELLKHSSRLYENQKNKVWKIDTTILELCGKTIGFIGTGSIAQEAAKRFVGFDVKIVGLNTSGKLVDNFHKCFENKDVDEMLELCDIVVITVPYTNKTHHFINEDKFSKMKDGVYLVNVARGSIIDEKALIKNVKQGKIAGAALDVVESEPLKVDNPLWELKNVIVTPHNSWISEMRNTRRFNLIYENLKRYKDNKKLINLVDLNKGY